MAGIDLEKIRDTLVSIAFEAGGKILAADPNNIPKGTKLNSVDIVTEADKAVEKLVSTRLQAAYPDYAFVGEETYVAGETRVTDAPTFIVDPIDGTTNFVHGYPFACISLGFSVQRKPVVGVVYNPFLDELYSAVQGKGAFLQKLASWPASSEGSSSSSRPAPRKLPFAGHGDVSQAPALRGLGTSLLSAEWGSDRQGSNFDTKVETFRRLAAAKEASAGDGPVTAKGGHAMVHSLRALGSAALNLCTVAAGQTDAYWEGGCWAWDVCAGWCILTEAGGIMVSGNPGEWSPAIDSRVYLAVRGAPSGQKELVEEIWTVIGDGRLDYKC